MQLLKNSSSSKMANRIAALQVSSSLLLKTKSTSASRLTNAFNRYISTTTTNTNGNNISNSPSKIINDNISNNNSNKNNNILCSTEYKDFKLDTHNFSEYIAGNAAKKWKGNVAYECLLTQQSISYESQWEQILAYSDGFSNMGLKKGDVVVVSLANGPLFPRIANALANIGVTAALLNPMFTPFEVAKILKLTDAKLVITQNILLPNLMQALNSMPDNGIKVLVDNLEGNDPRLLPLSSVLSSATSGGSFQAPTFDYKDTTAFMMFSSGTTGPPKGVELTHFAMTASVDIHNSNMDINYLREGGYFLILPQFHIYGLMHTTSLMASNGIKVLTMPIFDYDLFVTLIKERRPAALSLVPPLIARLALDPAVTADHLSSVMMTSSGGSNLTQPIIDAFRAKSRKDMELWIGYGMTEFPTIAKGFNLPAAHIGKLQANVRAKVVDLDTGFTAAPGGKGELCVQGPHMMKGYYKNPTATAETIVDGWLHTGDIGYIDQEGNIILEDRIKDMIKHKGFQVSPAELEDVIREVPGVADVCVVGVKHERDGEVPKAYIVVKEGEEIMEKQVHDAVKEKLSAYKSLKGGIEFVGSLPTSASGKVLRWKLRN